MNAYPKTWCSKTSGAVCFLIAVALTGVGSWNWFHNPWDRYFEWMYFVFAPGFFRASYLAWFRWSPLALRHVVGGLFAILTVWLLSAVEIPFRPLVLPICYVVFRMAASLLSRCAFGAPVWHGA